jgi:hypothetical protein
MVVRGQKVPCQAQCDGVGSFSIFPGPETILRGQGFTAKAMSLTEASKKKVFQNCFQKFYER